MINGSIMCMKAFLSVGKKINLVSYWWTLYMLFFFLADISFYALNYSEKIFGVCIMLQAITFFHYLNL